jgi:hypothetical protein
LYATFGEERVDQVQARLEHALELAQVLDHPGRSAAARCARPSMTIATARATTNTVIEATQLVRQECGRLRRG